MDAAIKKRWVEALRSGKYAQGKGLLQTDAGTFCCLGVLCAVQGWDTLGLKMLNPDQLEKVGLRASQQEALVYMNDGLHGNKIHSFVEIADHVERTL